MLSDAFCRYIKEYRKPCTKKRNELISAINQKLHYSCIQTNNIEKPNMQKVQNTLAKRKSIFTNAPKVRRLDIKEEITQRQNNLREYKEELESLNEKANLMFEHMKQINKLVSKKCSEIEGEIQNSEGIFIDALNQIVRYIAAS